MGPESRQEPLQTAPQAHKPPDQPADGGYHPAPQAAGRAGADRLTQKQPEVEARDVHQQALQDVRMPPKVHPAHPAGLKQVRKRTLNQLATTPQQTPAPLAPDPAPVPYTASRASGAFFQHRRPRSGSAI